MLFAYVRGEEQVWVYLNSDDCGGFSFRSQENQLFLIACFKSHQESVGAFGCLEPQNQCCRQAERGISAERRGGQDTLVSLTEHSWQLVVLCVVKPLLVLCLKSVSPEKKKNLVLYLCRLPAL